MGLSTKIYFRNKGNLLKKIQDFFLIQLSIEDVAFYDFSRYAEFPDVIISNDIGRFVLNTYQEPSYWLVKPDIEMVKTSPITYINDNMNWDIHPDILNGLHDLLDEDEAIYFILHHERGDNPYDDVMIEIKRWTWQCHVRGYEGDTDEFRLFELSNVTEEYSTAKQGEFNMDFINKKIKINNEFLINDGVNLYYCQGHYEIDRLDLEKVTAHDTK